MNNPRYKITYSNSIDIFDNFSQYDYIPLVSYPFGAINTNAFKKKKELLKKNGGIQEIKDFYPNKEIDSQGLTLSPSYTPRNYQKNIVHLIESKHRNNGIIEAPTGAGKTDIIAFLIAVKNLTTLIIVPSASLVYQTRNRLLKILDTDYSNIGICADSKKELNRPILISTWQSLQNHSLLNSVHDYGYNMVVVDEVHKASAKVLSFIVSSFKSEYKFGFSATVYRTHQNQIDSVYKLLGKKIAKIDIDLLYQNDYLIKPKIQLFSTKSDLSVSKGVTYYFRNKLESNEKMRWVFANRLFKDSAYSNIAPSKKTIKQVVTKPTEKELSLLSLIAADDYIKGFSQKDTDSDNIFKKKLGLAKTGVDLYSLRFNKILSKAKSFFNQAKEQGVVLFNTIEACNRFSDEMLKASFKNIILVHGQTEGNYEIIEQISSGKMKNFIAVSTVQFLGEGNDIPSLKKVLVGSPIYPPFSDMTRLQQVIGRAMRPEEGNVNKKCRIVIADDLTHGWLGEKKNMTYQIIDEVVKPDWIIESKKILMVSGEKRSGKDTFVTHAQKELLKNDVVSSVFAFATPLKNIISKMLDVHPDELEKYKNDTNKYSIVNNGKFISFKKYDIVFKEVKKIDLFNTFFTAIEMEFGAIVDVTEKSAKEILSISFKKDGYSQTFRELLQSIGFDGIGSVFGSDILAKKMVQEIQDANSSVVFVSDARIPNEIDVVKNVFKDVHILKIQKDTNKENPLEVKDSHSTETLVQEITPDYLIENNKDLLTYHTKIEDFVQNTFSKELSKNNILKKNDEIIIVEEETPDELSLLVNSF